MTYLLLDSENSVDMLAAARGAVSNYRLDCFAVFNLKGFDFEGFVEDK